MPYEMADELRRLSVECSQFAKECSNKSIANEIEGIGAELAEKAGRIDI